MKIIYFFKYVFLGFIAILGFFKFLEILTNKYYKPSVSYVRDVLHVTHKGEIDYSLYDEFTCVPIHYYPELEAIRLKYVEIVEDPALQDELKEGQQLKLNESGREQLKSLLGELEQLPEIITNPKPDSWL